MELSTFGGDSSSPFGAGHEGVGDGAVLCVGYLAASELLVDVKSALSTLLVRTTKNISRHCLFSSGGHIHP